MRPTLPRSNAMVHRCPECSALVDAEGEEGHRVWHRRLVANDRWTVACLMFLAIMVGLSRVFVA